MTQRILEAGEIGAGGASEFPTLVLPERSTVFRSRAARLRQLAQDHPLSDYLKFAARVADIQQSLLDARPALALPSAEALQQSRTHGMPPLNAQGTPRSPEWRIVLADLLGRLAPSVSGPAHDMVLRLQKESTEFLEGQADRVLGGITAGLDFGAAPLVGAALQVCWTHRVIELGRAHVVPIDVATVCPACGMRPVASIARSGGAAGGHRYLHCALCSTEWYMVRIKCTDCESTTGIQYFGIEGGSEAVKAECCDSCKGYLKILYMEKDAFVEPVADDLASTGLDLLMADEGRRRTGPNLFLFATDAE